MYSSELSGDAERERRPSVLGGLDRCASLLEDRACVVDTTGGDEVVDEAGEMAGAKGHRKVRQVQGMASSANPDLGRDREHLGDAGTDLGLLKRGQRGPKRAVCGERDSLR